MQYIVHTTYTLVMAQAAILKCFPQIESLAMSVELFAT